MLVFRNEIGTAFAVSLICLGLIPLLTQGLALKTKSETNFGKISEGVSVENLTEGNYWIQSVSDSSLLIGAFKNGSVVEVEGIFYEFYPANVSAQTHDVTGNLTVENSLQWNVYLQSSYNESTSSIVTYIETRGGNLYNRMNWMDLKDWFPQPALWTLYDMGNGTTAIRDLTYPGASHVEKFCLSENGLSNDLGYHQCSRIDPKQLWRLIPVGDSAT